MRKTLLASATLLGIALAASGVAPAFAEDMTPAQYLQQAQAAVQQHHTMTALTAINSAENQLLKDGVAQEASGARETTDPPVIEQIGKAREAVQQHHWEQADHYITAAMSHPSTAQ